MIQSNKETSLLKFLFLDYPTYNSVYPLSDPYITSYKYEYKIALIADLDTDSKQTIDKSNHKYISYLLRGTLTIYSDYKRAFVELEKKPTQIESLYSYGDRGMELSELIVYNGKLYSCDDRTGMIFEISLDDSRVHPWVVLIDGDGQSTNKGFKCEWMSVKDDLLYVGGLGKEWTTATGELVNHNPQWIKVVNHLGYVQHIDWTANYNKIRQSLGYSYPGYMIFESGVWNKQLNKWFFLPRRASKESYDEKLDEKRATNILIKTDAHFESVNGKNIGELNLVRGYSSFKFIPNLDDPNEYIVVALKTEEDAGRISSYITVFNINGFILLKDQLVSDKFKYEGIEFV